MAKGSGRRSTADINAAQFQSFLEPVRELGTDERAVWDRVVSAWPANHFIKSDAEILTQYCAVCIIFDTARVAGDFPVMEKAGRLLLTYATKLRITPQSRYNPQTVNTVAKRGRENEAAADRLLGGSAWVQSLSNIKSTPTVQN